ncbi:MAG: amidohydrolase [Bacteroidales bacterium]|nr:amidohydrolase [Bacteroidales bacterium]
MDIRESIRKHTSEILEDITGIRRHLHKNPELSFREFNTSGYIRSLLDAWGFEYKFPVVDTGIVALLHGKNEDGPVIALRSDMDGLPIKEQTGLPFSSANEGVMHACGHDIHMSCLLGTMRVLQEHREFFNGKVLFIFQPGEEKLPGGAKLMLEEGIFNENQPDLILAQHVLPEMEVGKVGFRPGEYMASSDEIYITVKGKGGHGALTENIHDPVLMASNILISLQQEINRGSPKGTPTVLSFGKVIADGAVNVIPDEVRIEGTFRTMHETWRKQAHTLIEQVASGIASGMGGKVDVEIRHGYPVLINDRSVTRSARSYAASLIGEENIVDMDIRMTAEDFAWFSAHYPSMMYRIGVKAPGAAKMIPLHTSRFIADEGAISTGINMMSWLAFSFLTAKE